MPARCSDSTSEFVPRRRRSRYWLPLAALHLSCLLLAGCPAAREKDWFVDIAESAGVPFVHFNGMSGEYYFCEMVGPGCGLLDYDNDGDLDLYLIQGELLGKGEGKEMKDARLPPPQAMLPLTDRLYRNNLAETGKLSFTDVTAQSKILESGYGMGIATGDYDNDGDVDFYLANFDGNQMWRNNGDGTFSEVTAATGTGETRWSSSAAFVDYDNDGWLDLFLCNYVNFSTAVNKQCWDTSSARDYCGPKSFSPWPSRLFHNRGDGTFEDVTARAGIAGDYGSALGIVCADLNGDSFTDIYVANDGNPNILWMNQRNGTFKNMALILGASANSQGAAEASMGIIADDLDGDLDFDLFTTHLAEETHTFYRNNGKGVFRDNTVQTNLGTLGRGFTGFGTYAIDYDNDSWRDIVIVNGEVRTIPALVRVHDPLPLHQKNQLFRNLGGAVFTDVSSQAGSVWQLSEVSRGAACGDLDNDGDMDIVVANNCAPTRILLNQVDTKNNWIGIQLRDARDKYEVLHVNIELQTTAGKTWLFRTHTDGSYCAANDPRVLAGLGEYAGTITARAHYPGGEAEEWSGLQVRRYHRLLRGTGKALPPSPQKIEMQK